jgi:hypothetical protein
MVRNLSREIYIQGKKISLTLDSTFVLFLEYPMIDFLTPMLVIHKVTILMACIYLSIFFRYFYHINGFLFWKSNYSLYLYQFYFMVKSNYSSYRLCSTADTSYDGFVGA